MPLKKYTVPFFLYSALVCLLLCGCRPEKNNSNASGDSNSLLPYYKSPDFEAFWFDNAEEAAKNIKHSLVQFDLINQNGEEINENNLLGKIHVSSFFETKCDGSCAAVSAQFQRLQAIFKNDSNVVLVSYTTEPENDTKKALKKYATLHGAIANKWHLLTGDKYELYTLARRFYFAEREDGYTKPVDEALHTENVVLVDKKGFVRGIYNGTLTQETERMVKDMVKLRNE